ncbi:hypothetical protein HNP99_001238 [Flavobacterium sp. 28A]|uniref:hypothetical protein n=1 Tax=Flavobacterium sp. 28A TaxID=2735895 RepID=UPI00156D9A84|nr:hypothetical protein [Flavobacterium sp. 28A]NRT14894.1 hypothetical protein [Flavobacterium sp. 28A]
MSVSVKSSVGKFSVGFTKFLLLSSNAFLARILANENAETLGPSCNGVSFLTTAGGVLFTGVTVTVGVGVLVSLVATAVGFATSAME